MSPMPKVEKQGSAPSPAIPRTAPSSGRGKRTRATLVKAARTIFERDGFLDARITDITAEATVASGTFYTYFNSKEEIFAAVVESVEEDMLHMHIRARVVNPTPYAFSC